MTLARSHPPCDPPLLSFRLQVPASQGSVGGGDERELPAAYGIGLPNMLAPPDCTTSTSFTSDDRPPPLLRKLRPTATIKQLTMVMIANTKRRRASGICQLHMPSKLLSRIARRKPACFSL